MKDLIALTERPDLPILGRVDETDYHLLEVVVARDTNGNRLYCLHRDWGKSPMGRIANLELLVKNNTERFMVLERELSQARAAARRPELPSDELMQELLRLRARCQELEAAQAAQIDDQVEEPEELASADPLPMRGGGFRDKEPGELDCPECSAAGKLPDKAYHTPQGLGSHRFRAHGVRTASSIPDRAVTLLTLPPTTGTEVEQPFCCEICGLDTFSPDLHNPRICSRCAKVSSNGHAVEVAA